MSNPEEGDLDEEEEDGPPPLSSSKVIEPSELNVESEPEGEEEENEPQKESVGVAPKSDNEDQEEDEDNETAESRLQSTTSSKQQSTTPSKQQLKDDQQSTMQSKQQLKDDQSTTASKQQLKKEESCNILDKLSKSKDAQNKKACEQGSCSYENITLGEPEVAKLQAIGENLLEIGRQLLQEMNLVEAILGKSTDKTPNKSNNDIKSTLSRTIDSKGSFSKRPSQSMSQQMIQGSKRNSKDPMRTRTSFHGKSILEEDNEGDTSVDSITQTPKNNELALYDEGSKAVVAAELRRKVSDMETQIVEMKDKVDRCEGQIRDVYKNLRAMVNSLFEETSALREQMNETNALATQSSSSTDEKIQNIEQQIVKMAQVIWELKCEIRAQMHFGKEEE